MSRCQARVDNRVDVLVHEWRSNIDLCVCLDEVDHKATDQQSCCQNIVCRHPDALKQVHINYGEEAKVESAGAKKRRWKKRMKVEVYAQ